MAKTKFTERDIQRLYDRASSSTFFMKLDAILGRSTEKSLYRKKAISLLHLTPDSTILEIACGIGYNFEIVQSYLHGKGHYVAIDISPRSLAVANGKIKSNGWTNMELINTSISRYNPKCKFDAILCTYALTIIPDYKTAINKIHDLLKPEGRFSVIGMKMSRKYPYKIFNSLLYRLSLPAGIDYKRKVIPYLVSKFKIDYYESIFMDYCYILSGTKK